MKPDKLTKMLALLLRLDMGVGVDIQPPFLTGFINDKHYKIKCVEVEHANGKIKKQEAKTPVTNLFLYINNKKGNNIVLITSKGTNKLLSQDITMNELADYILYRNEMEFYENNIFS